MSIGKEKTVGYRIEVLENPKPIRRPVSPDSKLGRFIGELAVHFLMPDEQLSDDEFMSFTEVAVQAVNEGIIRFADLTLNGEKVGKDRGKCDEGNNRA
jgi:hypothetical protein